ncbi:Gldg family protein [Haloferula chungangensis]|uniref:Gldg family protein n=1 Tax=Haloferula chungangensis TaxID=1048331 RepID=A0ABW2L4N7_9BACT
MSKEGKTIHPVTRAVLAIVALIVIVVAGNMLVSTLGVGHKAIDLTEDKIHSLSPGTEAILEELAAPVVIRYYATRSTDYMPEDLKLHMRRVDDLLAEYESLSNGKLQVENLDPEPDTDEEDAANLDGIAGQSINNENLYFGIAISCLDRTAKIPFLDPNDETMLEYQISRAIADVSATRKPTLGFMSALPIAGASGGMPGQGGSQPWIIYNQLRQSYDIEDLTMTPESIDPEKYKVVLVLHPADITPEAEFALDQYILKGGTVIACVDPFSVAAQMSNPGNPMMGQQGAPTSSTLPTLMKAWGVSMPTTQTVGDSKYITTVNTGRGQAPGLAVLTVPQEGMPQDDSIVTRDLASVTLFLPGGMSKTGGAGVAIDSLIQSSNKSGLLDNGPASRLDPSLITSFRPDGQRYDLALHLHGSFKSAFPDGKPGEEKADESQEEDEGDDAEEEKKDEEPKNDFLTEASAEGNVFIISDVDAFFDSFAYSAQHLGNMQIVNAINGNSSLLMNLIDQAASSTHLIGSRSRAATSRPFTVFQELEAAANEKVGAKIIAYEEEARKAQVRLQELQSQKAQGSELYLSPEQEAEIRKLKQQQVDARRQIRDLQKELRRDKDAISGKIILLNIFGVPSIVILVGLGLFTARRFKTRAR